MAFTETVAGLVYTGSVSIPAGARVLDILVETSAAWTAATADLDVGDSDATDALASALDVSAVAYQSGNTLLGGTAWGDAGGNGDTYAGGTAGGTGKLYPAGDVLTAVITATVPGGPTGHTAVTVLYEFPGVHRLALAA